jgi:hypothetical protein
MKCDQSDRLDLFSFKKTYEWPWFYEGLIGDFVWFAEVCVRYKTVQSGVYEVYT